MTARRSEALAALLVPPLVMWAVGPRQVEALVVWAVIAAALWMLICSALPEARWQDEAAAVTGASSIVAALAAGWFFAA